MSAITGLGNRVPGHCDLSARGTRSVPAIADIQRFSLDNGPGIRSIVFLKGCALRCAWCHNPELQDPRPQVSYLADACIGCRSCLAACRDEADPARPRAACSACGRCASACPTGALRMIGTRLSPARLAAILLEDAPFYRVSGGGVTFSGGEPALFSRYCAGTARILKASSVHVAIQTAGMFRWDEFERTLLPLVDEIYFDLKAIDSARYRRLTGCSSEPIIGNFRRLAAGSTPMIATMVLVPGVNDDARTIDAMRSFVLSCGVARFELRPFVPANGGKRRRVFRIPIRHLPDTVFPEAGPAMSGAA